MTSIALNPGIILPATPHVHNGCCGHAHHRDVQSHHDNELARKQVETLIQKQLHHAVPDKVANEQRTNSPANLSRHNHSGCSDGTCSIKQPSMTESRSSGGAVPDTKPPAGEG